MIYLAKSGKIFGPYSDTQIEKMKQTGEISQFFWMWNETQDDWKPLDQPPAGKPTKQRTQRIVRHDAPLALEVVCLNRNEIISGSIRLASATGCEFIAGAEFIQSPFGKGHSLAMNILDADSGDTMDTHATIQQVTRESGRWVYALSWEKCPEIVEVA